MQVQALLNGEFIDAAQLALSPADAGFVQGVTVTEQLRTFGDELFLLEEHLGRFQNSLRIVGIDLRWPNDQLAVWSQQLIEQNRKTIDAEDDLGLCIFATPGPYAGFSESISRAEQLPPPMLAMHTYRLAYRRWYEQYDRGTKLRVSAHRQISPLNWPLALKCRSRMHYYLADQQVRAVDPNARALLLDVEGKVSETPTANVVAYFQGDGLLSPPDTSALSGISLEFLSKLAARRDLATRQRSFGPEELAAADEVFLTSTPFCILPVTHVDDRPIGSGQPGPMFTQLIDQWSEAVGRDIVRQAHRFAGP